MTLEEIHWKHRLKQERVRRNLRQADLAEQLGTSPVTVQRWEKGSQTPSPYFRIKLSLLFEKSVAELGFGETPSAPSSPTQEEALPAPELALWHIPHPRNPHFAGREDMLAQLQQRLAPRTQEQPRTMRRLALTGLGGIGKTQLAVEYAYRAQEQGCYRYVLWLNAASEEAILDSFLSLAELLPGEVSGKKQDQRKLVAAVRRWLEECSHPWLLIVDNADEPSLVQPFLPQRGQGSILLTTRAHAAGMLAVAVEVVALSLEESTQLLLQRAQRLSASAEERAEARSVVQVLGGFPLALDQAGAYVEETGCSFDDYLQLYQLYRQKLLARRGKQASNYPASVATTWTLTLRKVEQTSPAAAELLRLCAFLAPDEIPEEMLRGGAACWPALLGEQIVDPLAFNDMIEVLLAFSLVRRLADRRALSVHRLVQTVQRDALADEEQRQWAMRVVLALNAIFPINPAEDIASWPLCRRYLGQVLACDEMVQNYELRLPAAAALFERAGRYLWEQASYTLVRLLYQHALQLRELQEGPDHPLIVPTLNELAIVHWKQGEYAEAERLYQRVLRLWEQQREPEQLEMAKTLNGLARLYRDQGRYEESERLYRQSLDMRMKLLGPEHSQVGHALSNLAIICKTRGKYEEAARLYQQALAILERQFGSEHPQLVSTLTGLGNLAQKQQSSHAEAEQFYQWALRILERQFGPEHSGIALLLSGLTRLYTQQGRYAEAAATCQRSLRLWEQEFGPEHPDLSFPLYDLAELYVKQRQYSEAEPLYQRALRLCERHLPPEHPRTVEIRDHLETLFFHSAARLHNISANA